MNDGSAGAAALPGEDPSRSGKGTEYRPYAADANIRDEAVGKDGKLRPGWDTIFESVGRHGPGVLAKWRTETARIARERGLAYRPARVETGDNIADWSLDPIPWMFTAERWQVVERGVSQRLQLYAAILEDVYGGGGRLFREKLVPPEIVLSHDGYVRALHDFPAKTPNAGLGIAATDVCFDNSGKLYALNDRFDHPFGLGLALENRTIVNSALPNLFRRCSVQKIGHFFIDWFSYLRDASLHRSDDPRIAIVDPSPGEVDSEIGFLANYCGVRRVLPSDLTVSDNEVWLKTLDGLKPIHALWRYSRGNEIDPLETRFAQGMGIAGLFEAMRAGKVTVANHPGSGFLQSPGLFPFLAALSRFYLGEELLVPPVATWWCGQETARQHVLANLDRMVIKSTGPHGVFATRYGSRLPSRELQELRATIESNPGRYVGQEEMKISTVPVSREDGFSPRGAVLRIFGSIRNNGNPSIMPGGLARVSTRDGTVVSTRFGGESKDVWVTGGETEEQVAIAPELARLGLHKTERVTSHVAENLYWTGRNAERVDRVTRFMARILDGRTFGFARGRDEEEEHEAVLLRALFSVGKCEDLLDAAPTPDEKLLLVLNSEACPVGIDYHLANLARTTNATREQWSPASIFAVESVFRTWSDRDARANHIFAFDEPLEKVQLGLAAFLGLNLDSMTRDNGWALLDAGRRIERATGTAKLAANLLRHQMPASVLSLVCESILFISDSLRTFQSIYHTEPAPVPMLELLLGTKGYPRSVAFLCDRLRQVLGKLPQPASSAHPVDSVPEITLHLETTLERLRSQDDKDEDAVRETAADDLDQLAELLATLGNTISRAYFSHARETVQ